MKKRIVCYLALVIAVLLVVTGVLYGVNASAVNNFVSAVEVCTFAAAACCVLFAFVGAAWADLGNLVAVPLTAAALVQLLVSSINTIADVTSGITMFGSQGGIDWIIQVAVLLAVALVAEIVSCFMSRNPKNA